MTYNCVGFLVVTLFALFLDGCHGYGWGVPEDACETMFPKGHGTSASGVAPPYEIKLSQTTYNPGEKITIDLITKKDGTDFFMEGAFLQVRSYDCNDVMAYGEFSTNPDEDFMQAVKCFGVDNSAIRHYSHAHIYNRTFYWTAPAQAKGHLVVRGTIARNKALFWTNVYSEPITDSQDNTDVNSLINCDLQTKYNVTDLCPGGQTGAASMATSGPVALLLTAAVMLLR